MAHSVGSHSTESIRNIAMLGHAGAGKTTLVEALLAKAGAIAGAGNVGDGTTVADHTAQEIALGHSLKVAVCHLQHRGCQVNLLDTPGYPDLLGRSLAVLPAVETAAIVIGADAGVELVARRAMQAAAEHKLCRLVIVSKIDAGGSLEPVLEEIRGAFGEECLPLNLPAGSGRAVADCFFDPSAETPDFSSVASTHTAITDQVVELDDDLMELYLEQRQVITPEQLHDPFERALRRGHLIPVCFVSAKNGAGLAQLLEILARLMPSPLEGNPPELLRPDGKPAFADFGRSNAAHDGHFVGHVFKIDVDPYLGRTATFRVHHGGVKSGDQVFVGAKRKAVKLAHLYRVQGKELREIPAARAGDIAAAGKADEVQFDDVLHASHDEDEVRLRGVDLPPPVYGIAVELAQPGQEKKLSDALHMLAAEDPSLTIELDRHSNETVIRGMGELHLKLVLERMRDELGLRIVTRPPQVPYRETVSRPADGHHRHKKQTGGAGQFGEVFLRVEPLPRGAGFEFVNEIVGGTIPAQYIPAVEKGVKQVLVEGAVAGYPIEDVRVVVYDGKHHSVDSKEVAFVAAGRKAFIDAIGKAGPVILEPVAKVSITAPEDCVGDVTGQLAGIRGRIAGSAALAGHRCRIEAEVPLAELNDYQTMLKSLTGGAGTFTMHLDHYAAAPPALQKELAERYRPSASEH